MKILAVDTDKNALERLAVYLKENYPDDDIGIYCDPLLAIQYGFNNEVNIIYTRNYLKLSSGRELVQLIQSKQKSSVQAYFLEGAKDQPFYIAEKL